MRLSKHSRALRAAVMVVATALLVGAVGVGSAVQAPAASAVAQNGYVFNNAWTLQNPGSTYGTYTYIDYQGVATNRATTSIPLASGSVGVTATFVPSSSQLAGTSHLANGTNQAAYGATSSMLLGAPTPSNLPALGLLTAAAPSCGGAVHTAAHQSFNGACTTGELTLTFSRPVTDAVLDVTGLGGYAHAWANSIARGSFISTEWTLLSPGVSFSTPATGTSNFRTTATQLSAVQQNANGQCANTVRDNTATATAMPTLVVAGCGSTILRGTYSSVTFRIDARTTPYSTFPTSTYGTGTLYNDNTTSQYDDGINGLNVLYREEAQIPGTPNYHALGDLQRVSIRLPEATGQIGNLVWNDTDRDGIQDTGEAGVAGVTVRLLDGNGQPVLNASGQPITTITSSTGAYLFSGLAYGTYIVEFANLPAGRTFTTQDTGTNDAVDSDVNPTTGRTAPVRIDTARPINLDVDAGLVPVLGSIGDRVWNDTDRDGIQDAGELGASGVTVTLYNAAGTAVATTTTAADGTYLFANLALGDYTVGFSAPSGMTFTAQTAGSDQSADSNANPATGRTATVSLTSASPNNLTVDAGLLAPFGSIGDFVWSDTDRDGIQDAGEPGLAGVTVILYNAAGTEVARTTTNSTGAYAFANLALGDYTVGFVAPAGTGFSPRTAGTDATKDSNADAVTGRSSTVSLTVASPSNTTIDAGILPQLGSIGDRVWSDTDRDGIQDAGESGLGGVTVTLYNAAGSAIATTTTGTTGTYLFPNLPLGEYSVGFSGLPSDSTFTTQSVGSNPALDSDANPSTGRSATVTLTSAAPNNLTVDAGVVPVIGMIGDRVWHDLDRDGIQDAGEPGIGGVTVTLSLGSGWVVATTTTAADGSYLFQNSPAGSYTVSFSNLPAGMTFTTAAQGADPAIDSDANRTTGVTPTFSLTWASPNNLTIDAGLVTQLGSIGDRVWTDLDRDGVQDAGEPGARGVTVVLVNAAGTEVARTVTDPNGAYAFSNLPLGDYQVAFTDLPAGMTITAMGAGADRALDSNADPATGRTPTISLTTASPNVSTIDAGLLQRQTVLPAAGGAGATPYLAMGGALLLLALLGWSWTYRRRRA